MNAPRGVWAPSSDTSGVSTRLVDFQGNAVPYMYNGTTWKQWSNLILLMPGDFITTLDTWPNPASMYNTATATFQIRIINVSTP